MGQKEKVLELAKGYHQRTNCFRLAVRRVEKALSYSYRDRRTKKREFRSSWIQTTNIAAREHNIKYSDLIGGLSQENIQLNRKMLAELAVTEPLSFQAVMNAVRPGVEARKQAVADQIASVRRAREEAAQAALSNKERERVPNLLRKEEYMHKVRETISKQYTH
eukprot:TRINITY_DN257_c0_g1_i3.p1 TRINITY_DN257_c0_g1~~TRINITY_DN257_c0_g1_i3.p1  ORF type:complete len:164 (+),score=52.12 TRINITY_DN257_c0_g1_i3:61-552(+)